MNISELKEVIMDCRDDCEVVVFALTEDELYRPFKNITVEVMNKGSVNEKLHLDISIHKEYKSMHFPDNPIKETVMDLLERKQIILEELEDINKELGEFK